MTKSSTKLYSLLLSLAIAAGSFVVPFNSSSTDAVFAEETPVPTASSTAETSAVSDSIEASASADTPSANAESSNTVTVSFLSNEYCGLTTFSTSAETGLSEVQVDIVSGETLNADQIPVPDITNDYLGWVTLDMNDDPVGNPNNADGMPYSNEELTSIAITENTAFYPFYQSISTYANGPFSLTYTYTGTNYSNPSPSTTNDLSLTDLNNRLLQLNYLWSATATLPRNIIITLNEDTEITTEIVIPVNVVASFNGNSHTITRNESYSNSEMILANGTLTVNSLLYANSPYNLTYTVSGTTTSYFGMT